MLAYENRMPDVTLVKLKPHERQTYPNYQHCGIYSNPTVFSRFLAHAPLSEHAPQLEYRRTEVNCNI